MKKHIANAITSIGTMFGILACFLVLTQPSWLSAEILLLGALLTDALDGKAARRFGSTHIGPYLDDIADFINFGLHPGLWIWSISGSIPLAALYICAIFYRLVRFTLKKQDTHNYFSGLPSPAAAIGVMGIMIVHPEPIVLVLTLGVLTFLTISQVPCMHVMKQNISKKYISLIILGCLALPGIYGGDVWAIGLAQLIITMSYIAASIILLLIPHYVLH
ncbi:CDP-alcohol phosphatidyltransferase family protein [Candidatus Gracilibacteria bacterium]|nr:CDP-alcohol phosphatidyltransferase family protein [Candidatus Gracilibacteria bacterium]